MTCFVIHVCASNVKNHNSIFNSFLFWKFINLSYHQDISTSQSLVEGVELDNKKHKIFQFFPLLLLLLPLFVVGCHENPCLFLFRESFIFRRIFIYLFFFKSSNLKRSSQFKKIMIAVEWIFFIFIFFYFYWKITEKLEKKIKNAKIPFYYLIFFFKNPFHFLLGVCKHLSISISFVSLSLSFSLYWSSPK